MNSFERLRREKDYSQAKLAELLNVSQSAVSKWEVGECLPSSKKLPVVASVLGCTVDTLLADLKPRGQ